MIKGIALLVAIAGLLALIWAYSNNQIHIGEVKCQAKDDAMLIGKLQQQERELEADKARIKEADDARFAAEQTLADLRAQPRARLLCHAAPVPAAGVESGVSTVGVLPPANEQGFDPSPAAYAVADEADEFTLACKSEIARITK